MFKFVEGLPSDVLAIEATGKVTHEDYRNTLIPRAEAMMAEGAPIKMLYVIGRNFTGYKLKALWDDITFGLKHWHDFSQIGIVTDHKWLRVTVNMFKLVFSGQIRLFRLSELPAA